MRVCLWVCGVRARLCVRVHVCVCVCARAGVQAMAAFLARRRGPRGLTAAARSRALQARPPKKPDGGHNRNKFAPNGAACWEVPLLRGRAPLRKKMLCGRGRLRA